MPRIALAVAALATGCSSNSARPSVDDGGLSFGPCDVLATCTPDPYGVCQHTCTPDPGPRLVNCGQFEQNFEFYDPPIWTFEEQVTPTETRARSMYSYTDNTTTIKTFTTADNNDPTGRHRPPQTWQPRTAVLPRCSDKPNDNNHAIHIQGGPFLSWGGGVGIGMKNFPSLIGTVANPEDAAKDFSGWDGISFWARRGPDSQAGFRVLVGDKYTDDDVSYLMYRNDPTKPRYCERVRECGCLDHHSCVAVNLERPDGTGEIQSKLIPTGCTRASSHLGDDQVMKFCGTPREISGAEGGQGSACNTCTETRCNDWWPAFPDDCAEPGGSCSGAVPTGTDRQYYGKPCSPYTMRNGIFGYWCFDPATERPAEPSEQCGDHWTRVVNLSTEWQFYTVPFSAMAQQGWAKRSMGLDLSSVSVMRFTWDGGFVDFWIDDVRVYKHKPQ